MSAGPGSPPGQITLISYSNWLDPKCASARKRPKLLPAQVCYMDINRVAGGAYLDRRAPGSGHFKFGGYMYRLRHYIASLFLTAALAAPISIMALPRPQDAGVQVRVYDKGHKDYHNSDNNENRAWGVYL